jgi:hypothetical protein
MGSSHEARRLTDDEQNFIEYNTNRAAWNIRAAPVIAKRMREVCKAEKDRMWAACPPELRKELRRIADANSS